MVKDKIELHVLRKLYGLMDEIFKMQPWEWIFEDDLFAVQDPDGGETAYISIMGELGEHRAVGAYIGALGLYSYWKMLDCEDNIKPEMLLETPQLQASFEDRKLLEPEDVEIIRQLGLTYRGKQTWPMFRSYRQGYMPWFTDDAENRFLEHILEQTIYVTERFMEDPDLFENVSDEKFFARIPETGNGKLTWKDGTIAVPPPPQPADIRFKIDRDIIIKVLNMPREDAVYEIDFFLFPSFFGPKGKRPIAAYMLLMVDKSSGIVLGHNLLQAEGGLEKMWGGIPQEVCNTLSVLENLPAQVHVQSDLLFQLLPSMADALDIELVQVANLTSLEEAKTSLMQFMGRR